MAVESPPTDYRSHELGRLRGLLRAIAVLGEEPRRGLGTGGRVEGRASWVVNRGGAEATVTAEWAESGAVVSQITPVVNWPDEFPRALERWLFPDKRTPDRHRRELVQQVMSCLTALVEPVAVWEYAVDEPDDGSECEGPAAAVSYAVEGVDSVVLLSLELNQL